MGGKIDAYVDCTSLYSYFAFTYLTKQRPLLEQYDVEIEFHPVFLGGINTGTGNKPPWTLPAKAKYGTFDIQRAIKWFKMPQISAPPFFPILSVVPQRAMIVIKELFPRAKFEECFLDTFVYSWVSHINIQEPANLRKLLSEYFSEEEVKQITHLMATPEYKEKLTANTKTAMEKGAFGAPWFWLTNHHTGKQEPLFGSDRWAYMWDFLGVDFEDVRIVDKTLGGKSKL